MTSDVMESLVIGRYYVFRTSDKEYRGLFDGVKFDTAWLVDGLIDYGIPVSEILSVGFVFEQPTLPTDALVNDFE